MWRQDAEPRPLPIVLDRYGDAPFAATPDFSSVLIMHNLSASGVICEHNIGHCPPPSANTGLIADLRNVATGHIRWSLTGKATSFSRSSKPAISPDGRYALISLPPDAPLRETIALVSISDGHVLQRINAPHTSRYGLWFSGDSRTAWVSSGNTIVCYQIDAGPT